MIALIRHGRTAGNLMKKYIGVTDEELYDARGLERDYPAADIVVTSPLKRCVRTAEIIYPDAEKIVIDDLREYDFGRFEGKTFEEAVSDAEYKKWLESDGNEAFPGGEDHGDFKLRSVRAFRAAAEKYKDHDIAFVVHGGTIMAVMQSIFGGGFYDYMVENGGGYIIEGNTFREIN